MALTEGLNPVELPWEEWSDGRPRRLKRGKHYTGDARVVERAARAAASEMDRAVITTVDQGAKWEYVWVQFADQSIEEGQPCRCGGRHFTRYHVQFSRCEVCGRTTVLREPKEPVKALPLSGAAPMSPEDAPFGTVTAARVLSIAGAEVSDVAIDEEVIIEGTFHAPREGMLASPRVIVRTDVVRAFAGRFPGFRRLEEPGTYRVRMRIPPDLLAPQDYSADFRMLVQTPEGRRLVPGVRVAFSAYDPSGEQAGREGVVRPRCEWTMEDDQGVEPPEHRMEEEPLDPDDGLPGEG